MAGFAEVLLLLYLLLASGDLFLRKLVEVLPRFRKIFADHVESLTPIATFLGE